MLRLCRPERFQEFRRAFRFIEMSMGNSVSQRKIAGVRRIVDMFWWPLEGLEVPFSRALNIMRQLDREMRNGVGREVSHAQRLEKPYEAPRRSRCRPNQDINLILVPYFVERLSVADLPCRRGKASYLLTQRYLILSSREDF